ncbi:MAG TPA: type II CAAX endopeptidase family protein [Intrasporangium sp.]|uniref:CPBP family intramembrane glutamic endopeptidase n=1 Tax=Intrasporangium sp. TaxID=1925024 RepID=UPI002D76E5D9|nr:type II CAAX endopeptidase family protein [Intrasporangium sp.]HET7399845.1 type II CAAX endopeptidase family protein [Intrasporangium sp.]
MTSPVAELRAFLRAALVSPVPRRHEDAPAVQRRRRLVVAATFVVGVAALPATLRIAPGDARFYPAAAGLAAVWAVGALASGPLHLGSGHTRRGARLSRPVVQSLALGVLTLVVFLVGALAVARVPLLREPVDDLLDHARFGSLPAVLGVTVLNGVVEELYFRGALYAALPRTRAVGVTAVLYTLTTVASGVPLLVLAAAVVGLLTALQRRVTGGVLGPMITHVTWSSGMLLLLPPVLQLTR